jgi:8-oxo-dGTP diphosphatase
VTGTPICVIRHAEAGDRERWAGPDEARPLSGIGRRRAEHLVEALAGEPFVQLLSSPFLRCMQTLEPLAEARGLSIDLRDELAEGQPWEYLEKVILQAEAEGPTAVSVHGDGLRSLMSALFERGIARRADGSLRKGAIWVLEVRDGAIVSARHMPAPPTD